MAKTTPRRVAIIGGGVSGLSAAWHLKANQKNGGDDIDVHLFESEDRLGGHAYTLGVDGVDVDIGFMVFNDSNYPNMTEWFKALGVQEEESDMSLSVSLDGGDTVEWNSDGLNGLLAKRSQVLKPSFYIFIKDMLRFNAEAPRLLHLHKDDPRRQVTIGQYLRDHDYSDHFCSHYLLPMTAAIWSASIEDSLNFPADELISFFFNHKLLQIFARPQWKTVANRSQSYTLKMKDLLGDRAHLSTPIVSAKKNGKDGGTYTLFTTDNRLVGTFDDLIFACHPPTASKILAGLDTPHFSAENLRSLLDQVQYADNVVYVHSDPKLMPARHRAWASWNCMGKLDLLRTHTPKKCKSGEAMEGSESGFGSKHVNGVVNPQRDVGQEALLLEGKDGRMKAVYVTYWLNRLQNLKTDQDIFVSLNPHQKPDPALTHKRVILAHPQFNFTTLQARDEIETSYQGKDGLWFCGAWAGYGFHEDGCRSGFQVATKLSQTPLPWASGRELMDLPLQQHLSDNASAGVLTKLYKALSYDLPVAICKKLFYYFLQTAIKRGTLELKYNDGSVTRFGDGTPCGSDESPVTVRIFEPWFFVKAALEYDLGLARSYMAGYFVIEPLDDPQKYDQVIRPPMSREETTKVIGDPIGLTRFFLLIIGNRDGLEIDGQHVPRKSAYAHRYSNAFSNASGLLISKVGSLFNFIRYKLTMDNSERGGSLKNIHAHYDLSNDLFTTFLDKETLMYSSAIYDAVRNPSPNGRGLVFRGTLEEAQWRKLDTLLDRAQIQPGQTMLDIGFGWGGLSIHAAKKYGCRVTGITLSVEQKALAEERVRKEGLEELITFEVVDYRTFARRNENSGKFDRVLSCEMIEAVGHEHLGEFYWAVEQVLKHDGILVMEAITTPEERYETYRRSTDFINTIIFPGGLCPSVHALVDAAYKQSSLTLEHIDNIGLHYAETLAEWRRRFNASDNSVRSLGFDDMFLRVWNYYMVYCEAAFRSQTINCLILVFSRQGCSSLVPLCETRSVTQRPALTDQEVQNWMLDG